MLGLWASVFLFAKWRQLYLLQSWESEELCTQYVVVVYIITREDLLFKKLAQNSSWEIVFVRSPKLALHWVSHPKWPLHTWVYADQLHNLIAGWLFPAAPTTVWNGPFLPQWHEGICHFGHQLVFGLQGQVCPCPPFSELPCFPHPQPTIPES